MFALGICQSFKFILDSSEIISIGDYWFSEKNAKEKRLKLAKVQIFFRQLKEEKTL